MAFQMHFRPELWNGVADAGSWLSPRRYWKNMVRRVNRRRIFMTRSLDMVFRIIAGVLLMVASAAHAALKPVYGCSYWDKKQTMWSSSISVWK